MATFFDSRVREVTLVTGGGTQGAGDVVGGLQTIDVAPQGQSVGGTLRRVCITDGDAQAATLTIYFFDSAPATIADNAAFTLTAADIAKIIGRISIASGDWVTIGSERWVEVKGSDVDIDFFTSDGNLYAYVVGAGTPTYSASGPTLRFFFQRD